MMNISELKDKSVSELNAELLKQREEQFKLRMRLSTGQLGQTHLLRQVRRDIARIKTVLTSKSGE